MGEVLKTAAGDVVMPLYGQLKHSDMEEKSPGEIVTIADRDAERIIAAGLSALCPFARVVGEEACASNPSLLNGLDCGDVWIIDPIDGTGNYTAGCGPFAIMAAMLREGEPVAACILDPVNDTLVLAEKGSGAWVNGTRICRQDHGLDLPSFKGIISDFERPVSMDNKTIYLSQQVTQVAPTQRCAGAEYPMVANGEYDFAVYWRTLVWDHAPGVLILEEAGGKAACIDGTPYRAGNRGSGLILANTPEKWDQIAVTLA